MLTLYDEFSGVGGTSRGASFVPGVEVTLAANHDEHACREHARNFPNTRHYLADVTKLDVTKMPRADIFTSSPACPAWTDANGVRRDFDKANATQATIPGLDVDEDPKLAARRAEYRRSRLLMEEVPRYLRAMVERGKPVLAGMVENVIQCRLWSEWDRWIHEIQQLGYKTRLIAFNSMHARPVRAPRAPQSRNRLYVGYWHRSLGRDPDWDRWLRPKAWCPTCDEWVQAIQVFKRPGADMGAYGSQYVYRCPRSTCRHRQVFPDVLPALAAIDLTQPGIRIGDRAKLGLKDLAPATLSRIQGGIARYWAPLVASDRKVRGGDGAAIPPLLPPNQWARTQTANTAAVPVPLLMRNNTPRGSAGQMCTPVTEPARTVTAAGHQSLLMWAPHLLVPYYGSSDFAQPAGQPVGALTTRARYGLASASSTDMRKVPGVDDVMFRMLEPIEIGRLMAFDDQFRNEAPSKSIRVRLYGNAVTPPVAEVIVSALAEAITGEQLEAAE